ncbi:MAG TPA: carboxypeptidase regulatory-like domain-containing protein [Gemmatimonadaceae bacterium]|nr:carboxypeptidase regulatory-like domain-containing protein [Gemmatimonadaceae bacterium]
MRRRLVVVMLAVMAGSSMAADAQLPAVHSSADTGSTSAAVVTGMIYDSVARAPLAGAVVQMRMESGSPRVYSVTTDSSGTFRIPDVTRGSYFATFFHPVLESLGIMPIVWRTAVTDSVTRVTYAVPSAATVWAATCGATSTVDSTGLIIGHVHDADSGLPLGGSVVSASWRELVIDHHGVRTEQRQIAATANDAGVYALCGVPADVNVLVRAEHDTASSGVVEIASPFRGLVMRDFGIASSAATTVVATDSDGSAARSGDGTLVRRGTASISGIVRAPGGDPLDDVELAIPGSDARATTDRSGRFTLADLAPGTFTLEARHVGFAPARVIVDLKSHDTTTVTVRLDKQVAVLNTVHVYGRRVPSRTSLTGFLERRQRGFGHFITKQDIENQHAFYLSDLLRRVPGVQVVPNQGFGHTVMMRGGGGFGSCQPVVYMDGVRVFADAIGDIDWLVDVQDVTGVEVYTGPEEAPPQYQGDGCGSMVIWTGTNQ